MKIAIGGKLYPLHPEMGYGGERCFMYLAEHFAKQGHEVVVFSPRGSVVNGCEVVEVNGYPSLEKDLYADAIVDYDGEFDGVILQDDFCYWNNPRLPFKYIYFCHGYKFPIDVNCKRVVCAGNANAKIIKNSAIIPFALDGDKFCPVDEIEDYYIWIGKVWHSGIKPLHHAVEAAVKTKNKLVICGIVEDVNYFNTKIKPHIDGVNVMFYENVNDELKIKLLQRAKALLSPQGSVETFGINHIEAFACGVPVIYNDPIDRFNEHAPIYYYGNSSASLRIDGSEDLTNKFAEKMGELKQEMRGSARKLFLEKFSLDIVANQWVKLFDE